MQKISTVEQFSFLKEIPVNSSDQLEFGHREIIATLEQIISNTPHNLTIGLFGSWGTGKSTIVEVLKANLKTKNIPLIIFDVWKHEGDALRRTFLKEVDSQLSEEYGDTFIKENNILQTQVYASASISSETYRIYTKKLLLNLSLMFLFTLAITVPVIILYNLFKYVFNINIFNSISLPSISTLLVSILTGGLLFKYLDSFIKVEKTDIKKDRYQDPHEFEQEFGNLVANLRDDRNKLVVTFDNLDRISGDNALKIISTIKTFLNDGKTGTKTVFFLIPCDVLAIKNHISIPLSTIGEEKEMYLEEFLRKFFNTSIWIPEFYSTELENFATAKLIETKVPAFQDDYLSWLITRVFYQSPRQIVQFINLLLSNYLLLKEFCENGGLPEAEFYKKNVRPLAKFLLIKQKFPEYLEKYRKAGTYNLYEASMLDSLQDQNFKTLLNQTEDIYISSLEPFFRYRISKSEQQIPGVSKLIQYMETEDENLLSYATEINLKGNLAAFGSVIKTYLQPIVNPVKKIKFINQYFKLSAELQVDVNSSIARDVINYICSNDAKNNIHFLETEFANGFLFASTVITKANKELIIAYYMNVLKEQTQYDDYKAANPKIIDTSRRILLFLLEHNGSFNELTISVFKEYLSENIHDIMIREQIISKPDYQQKLISVGLKKATIQNFNISNKTQLEILDNLELLNLFLPKKSYCLDILAQMALYWDSLFSVALFEKYEEHCLRILAIFAENFTEISELEYSDITNYEKLVSHIMKVIAELGFYHLKKFIPFILSVYNSNAGGRSADFLFADYLEFSPENAVNMFIDLPMGLMSIVNSSSKIQKIFVNHFIDNTGDTFRDKTVEFLTPIILKAIIGGFIEGNQFEQADLYLHQSRNDFDEKELEKLQQQVISKFKSLIDKSELSMLPKLVRLIKFIFDNDSTALSSTSFWSYLTDLLADSRLEQQQKGYDLFIEYEYLLSKAYIKTEATNLLDRIISEELINNYFIQEILYKLFGDLEKEAQITYMSYLFEEIVPYTKNSNVMLLCSKFVGHKYRYSLMGFLNPIEALIQSVEDSDNANSPSGVDIQVFFKEVYHRLRKDNTPRAYALSNSIKKIMS